ncbi:MAG: 4-(cytidine 5'-diphospho)-2-C-methyl-D-erythritol kinase [Thermoguttaceae bacterium]
MLLINTPAKINLFFEIIGKRSDGFHEIVSLACPVSVFDTVEFYPFEAACEGCNNPEEFNNPNGEANYLKNTELRLNCFFDNDHTQTDISKNHDTNSDIPLDSDNLVIRAFELLRRKNGVKCGGTVRLHKRIPSQAGLGGGSSDAAAALKIANTAWSLGLSNQNLAQIGAELGSDVPLFFSDGPVICRGRGEILTILSELDPNPNANSNAEHWKLHFVLLKPPFGLPTPKVYATYANNEELKNAHKREIGPILDAYFARDLERFGNLLFNRLEEPAKLIWSDFHSIYNAFAQLGCVAVRMSGSGTSFFGLCRDPEHSEYVADKLK